MQAWNGHIAHVIYPNCVPDDHIDMMFWWLAHKPGGGLLPVNPMHAKGTGDE
jgi:hypothetical protein